MATRRLNESDSTDRALGKVPYPPQYFMADTGLHPEMIASPEEALSGIITTFRDKDWFVGAEIDQDSMGNSYVRVRVKDGFVGYNVPIIQRGITVRYARVDDDGILKGREEDEHVPYGGGVPDDTSLGLGEYGYTDDLSAGEFGYGYGGDNMGDAGMSESCVVGKGPCCPHCSRPVDMYDCICDGEGCLTCAGSLHIPRCGRCLVTFTPDELGCR